MSDAAGRPAASVLSRWLGSFLAANVVSALVLVATGHGDAETADIPVWVFGVAALAMWGVHLAVVRASLRAEGSGLVEGTSLTFRGRDLAGVPLGVASQLVLVTAVMWPLGRLFPGTFDYDKVSERANDLASTAAGAWVLVLVGVVVVGAPIVEEIVYRGWIQPRLESSWGRAAGVGFTAVLFAAVHLQPVEFPGLLAFALVLGVARSRSGRLGLPVVTHLAFNATGLLLALR